METGYQRTADSADKKTSVDVIVIICAQKPNKKLPSLKSKQNIEIVAETCIYGNLPIFILPKLLKINKNGIYQKFVVEFSCNALKLVNKKR